MVKIVDNLLPKRYLEDLQSYFLSENCEWFFNDNLTDDNSYDSLGSFGFNMRLHWNGYFVSNYVGTLARALVFTVQEEVEKHLERNQRIVRARADMTMYNPTNYRHELHTDFPQEHTTAIFYMNTSDGNTLLFDRKGDKLIQEVEPVENRLVIFDGLMQHTGHSPSKHKSRILINMNFMNPELVDELNRIHGNNGRHA
jgi:hypothetical protein